MNEYAVINTAYVDVTWGLRIIVSPPIYSEKTLIIYMGADLYSARHINT